MNVNERLGPSPGVVEPQAQPNAVAKSDGRAGNAFPAPVRPELTGPNAALKEPPPPIGDGYRIDHPCAARLMVLDREAGVVGTGDGSPMRKKIAICGFASSTRYAIAAVTDDPEWEIWIVNQFDRHCPAGLKKQGGRADRHFDIHWNWDQETVPGTDYRKAVAACGIPFYMLTPAPDIPTAVRYPIDRLLAHFQADYFTSTIAYMLALATYEIDQRVRLQVNQLIEYRRRRQRKAPPLDIVAVQQQLYGEYVMGIFGVDLTVGSEYFCVAPETKVLTADLRWVPASSVVVGDMLVGFDEHAPGDLAVSRPNSGRFKHGNDVGIRGRGRRWKRAIVTGADRIVRPCYRITMTDGTVMTASAEHQWLTGSAGYRWRRTDELVTPSHRKPTRLVKLIAPWGAALHSWDAGYLAAAFDGEGYFGGSDAVGKMGSLSYAQKDNAMAAAVRRALGVYEFPFSRAHGDIVDSYRITGGRSQILRFMGQIRPQRLLKKFDPDKLGRVHALECVPVEACEYVGDQEVIALGTSAKTFVAEGYASHNSEKACAEFWIGQATGRGISVQIPKESALCKQMARYGYDREPYSVLKLKEIEEHQAKLRAERDEMMKRFCMLEGGIECDEIWRQIVELRLRGTQCG